MTSRMALRLKLVAAAFALLIVECLPNPPLVRAQSEPRFGIEIPDSGYPSDYVTLDGSGIVATYPMVNLRRVPGARPTGRVPTDLQLEYKVENDSVVVTASVLFADSPVVFDASDDPPRQKLGVYSAKIDQSAAITEMTRLGFEPLRLNIVAARRERSVAPAVSVPPQAVSKVPSMWMEIVGQDSTSCKVALHNLSAMTVTAFSIFTPSFDGNGGGGVLEELGARDEIAPGASGEVRIGVAAGSPQIILQAAFYEDGSYEGDVRAASEIGARRIGAGIQRQHVDQLVAGILSDDSTGDKAKVARIRTEADRLAEDPDQQMLERVQSEFPGLSGDALERAKANLKAGLRSEKTRLAYDLKQFEGRGPDFPISSLAAWWSRRLPVRPN